MRRKIYDKLLQWKQEKNGKTALMIEGARRVGKSYIAQEFARNEYDSYILIDFSKAPARVKGWFDEYLEDIPTLLQNIQLHYKKQLTPRRSLIIFDEVQKCPRAREAIKALVEDGRFDYLETGSLISIKKNVENIVIPSEEDGLDMYPMDFEEFLWAMGEETLMDFVRMCFDKKQPVGQSMHRKIMDYFRLYLIVGGMPQAVLEYLDTRSFEDVDRVKRQILNLYHNCIERYAGKFATKVNSIYEAIPAQLQLHDHKFQLADIDKNARFRNYASAFFWLRDAKMVNLAFNTTEPSIGLGMKQKDNSLKCYMNDTGLMISHAFNERGIVSDQLYQKILKDKLEINAGMLMENIVAQMLTASGCKLFFYSNSSRENKEDRMEIDFLISKKTITSRHNISPIEVKSSTGFTTISLEKCINKYSSHLAQAYIIHTGDVKPDGNYLYIPLYMVPCL